jgi:hypothetical protein
VPGDRVRTHYGPGTVLAFSPASPLNREAAAVVEGVGGEAFSQPTKRDAVDGPERAESTEARMACILAPRVAVRLPFGVGFFSLAALMTNEDPSWYTDKRLALRWRGMYETAVSVASTLDIEAMAVEEGRDRRLLPLGAEMLPSVFGRGSLLVSAGSEIATVVDAPLYDCAGVVGVRGNRSVPRQLSEMEKLREEKLTLQAKALQLRNKLYRQRRIRILNERTLSATQDRAVRVESLVAEMRTDLKSLKARLDEDIYELGVNSETSLAILASFYRSLDSHHSGEPSPPKRLRRDDADMEDEATEEYLVEEAGGLAEFSDI